jgi:hypothetical protein
MAIYQPGEVVFVPASQLGITDPPYYLASRTVLRVQGRSIFVDSKNGLTAQVATAKVLPRMGVLLIRIGDLASESELLDPLYKCLLHYLRLLIGPEVVGCQVRSYRELEMIWSAQHATKMFAVVIGHGKKDAVEFAVDGWVDALRIKSAFETGGTEVSIISTACKTGLRSFSQTLSRSTVIREVVAPQHSVPGPVAAQFVQNYFAERLVAAQTGKTAFTRARKTPAATCNFRRWKNGALDM